MSKCWEYDATVPTVNDAYDIKRTKNRNGMDSRIQWCVIRKCEREQDQSSEAIHTSLRNATQQKQHVLSPARLPRYPKQHCRLPVAQLCSQIVPKRCLLFSVNYWKKKWALDDKFPGSLYNARMERARYIHFSREFSQWAELIHPERLAELQQKGPFLPMMSLRIKIHTQLAIKSQPTPRAIQVMEQTEFIKVPLLSFFEYYLSCSG